MLGSSVMLADDGGGPAAVVVTAAVAVAALAAAAAAAVAASAGRAGARLPRGAAVEQRLHGFIELSASLAILFVLFCFVLSALLRSMFHFGALPSLKAQAACVLFLVVVYSCFYFGVGVLEPFCFHAEGEGVNIFCGVVWA